MANEVSTASIEEQLLQMERERRDALVGDDMTRFAALLAGDLVHVHTTGKVHGKSQLIDHASGFLKFLDIERGTLLIRELGPDAAVMTGPMKNVLARRGVDERVEVEAFVTQVWVRNDGDWQIASFHAVRTGEPAA